MPGQGHSEIDKEIKGLFYESYQRELKNVSGYQSAEEVLHWQLERKKIHFLILEGTGLRELYPQKEMRRMDAIHILVSKGDLVDGPPGHQTAGHDRNLLLIHDRRYQQKQISAILLQYVHQRNLSLPIKEFPSQSL